MFYSILFPSTEAEKAAIGPDVSDCLKDLNLTPVFDRLLSNEEDAGLSRFYTVMLRDRASITYRQDILREIEPENIREPLAAFSGEVHEIRQKMNECRALLAIDERGASNDLVRGTMLQYAEMYCNAVDRLVTFMKDISFTSEGMKSFSIYVRGYYRSSRFVSLWDSVKALRAAFTAMEYCMYIQGGTMKIRRYDGQEDYATRLHELFDKFCETDAKDYHHKLNPEPKAEHVEAAVFEILAKLYPEEFKNLRAFCESNLHFDDEILLRFSREVRFYLNWLDLTKPLTADGLAFCFPELAENREHVYSDSFYDLSLALQIGGKIIANSFRLDDPEKLLVITGPNQGGKTTFARAFGQIHYLASLGLSVPGSSARLYVPDKILTHFEREEHAEDARGKLQDDLVRLKAVMDRATSKSLMIINEIFASTTLRDALLLGTKMMDHLTREDIPAVIVTFLDELAEYGPNTVSMMSMVEDDDDKTRTYRIIRKPPDGLAFALHIAARHGLTYEQLKRRMAK